MISEIAGALIRAEITRRDARSSQWTASLLTNMRSGYGMPSQCIAIELARSASVCQPADCHGHCKILHVLALA